MISVKFKPRFVGIFTKPFKLLLWFVISHAKVCLYAFDSINDAPKEVTLDNLAEYRKKRSRENKSRIHRFFILPICLWTFLFVDTLWILWGNNFEYNRRPIPELLTHRLYAPKFWKQGDMLVLTVSTGIGLNGLTLLVQRWLNDRYCMYFVNDRHGKQCLIVNGKVWNKGNSKKLAKFRAQTKPALLWVMGIMSNVVGYLFFLWNFLHTPFTDVFHYAKMALIVPLITWYCVYSALTVFCHFAIVVKYVLIKQAYLFDLQKQLLHQLKQEKRGKTNKFATFKLFQNFQSVNTHLAYQCAEIRGYNRFWRLPVTILFSVDILCVCYLLYTCLFYEQTFEQFVYFFFYLIEMFLYIFGVISLASLVDRNNDLCYEKNMQICMAFEMNFYNRSSIRQLINIEKIATNRNFSKCCFRLANGYRLDSTAFNMATFIMSSFFLFICRQNQNQK